MYEYIKGNIIDIEANYIVLDNNGIGFIVYVASPYSYNLGENKVFIYQYVKEDEISLYGFKSKEEKNLFLKLIGVKGLGCKMALPMLATGKVDDIINAINYDNINYLKKFPKIGDKVAKQIVLDLKGKLVAGSVDIPVDLENRDELIEALVSLGYKEKDVKKVIKSVDSNLSIENQIKESLKLMLK